MSGKHAIWARAALAEQVSRRRKDGRVECVLAVPCLDTARMVLRLEALMSALPGMLRWRMDRTAQRVRVVFDDEVLPLPQLLDQMANSGCPAEPLAAANIDDRRREAVHDSLRRLLVAGLFAMQAMMFAFVLYLDGLYTLDPSTLNLFRWLSMLAAIPVVGYAAWPFYRHALADLQAARFGIDQPVALAVVMIFAASTWSALHGSDEVYFESVSMFVFVLLVGRHLELRARLRHGALGDAAAAAAPLVARRRQPDGSDELVAIAELQPGDRIRVEEGQVVPVDGTVAGSTVHLDESLLTGESRPRARPHGDAVCAGSVLLDGPLQLAVCQPAAASGLARLQAITAEAGDKQVGDPAVRGFVLRVFGLTLATLAFWLWLDSSRAFDAAVAVLVVACPCAFALAAPATLTRAVNLLARCGVLVTRPSALLSLARIDHALFDKTGTLTAPGSATTASNETVRGDAEETLVALREAGIASVIASGDNHERVAAVAAQLGIDQYHARQSPEDKRRLVRDWQAAGARVLAVGDGSNDAAALAAADVSASPTSGTDLARRHADLILGGGLGGLALARRIAVSASHVLAQNRRWSLVYNLAAIPFAAAGLVPPWLAALGMALSSLVVVLNTLRINVPSASVEEIRQPRWQEHPA